MDTPLYRRRHSHRTTQGHNAPTNTREKPRCTQRYIYRDIETHYNSILYRQRTRDKERHRDIPDTQCQRERHNDTTRHAGLRRDTERDIPTQREPGDTQRHPDRDQDARRERTGGTTETQRERASE